MFEADKRHPLGWPPYGVPESQIQYLNYCGIGELSLGALPRRANRRLI